MLWNGRWRLDPAHGLPRSVGDEGGGDLFGEEGEAGAVVGHFREVDDRVAHAHLAELGEPLGNLLGRADQGAFGEVEARSGPRTDGDEIS
jgi:hypothetical protein